MWTHIFLVLSVFLQVYVCLCLYFCFVCLVFDLSKCYSERCRVRGPVNSTLCLLKFHLFKYKKELWCIYYQQMPWHQGITKLWTYAISIMCRGAWTMRVASASTSSSCVVKWTGRASPGLGSRVCLAAFEDAAMQTRSSTTCVYILLFPSVDVEGFTTQHRWIWCFGKGRCDHPA